MSLHVDVVLPMVFRNYFPLSKLLTKVGCVSGSFRSRDLRYPLKFPYLFLSSPPKERSDVAYDPLPYSKNVEKHILECIQGGVGIREMIASMQHLQGAPKSLSTLYKIYGPVIHAERARINAAVGARVIDQAINGDPKDAVTFKSQELFLRSKGGWSPKETVETSDASDEDVDESAVNTLMKLLGKGEEEED